MKRVSRNVLQFTLCALAITGCASAQNSSDPESTSSTSSALSGDTYLHTYVVLFKEESVPHGAASVIAKAGGTLVYSYDEIGVAIARSDDSAFRANLLAADKRIENATSTTAFGVPNSGSAFTSADTTKEPTKVISRAASGAEPLASLQWDMPQIHVPEAHAITSGRRSVLVGDIDTGIDATHPDLIANIDFQNSVSCIGGVPNQDPAAWNDDAGHGTHTAGTIAAAANGIGMVGVAPNVRLAAIKAGDANELFFPEAVVCAFMWAGSHHMDVTNNSYYADPYLFNCPNDPEQHAIWKAEQRAIRYAMGKGVTVVAAEGNQFIDLSNPTIDDSSPDYPPGAAVTRPVTKECIIVPLEIAGVIGVGADANLEQKSLYSNWGHTDVVAPGGDSYFQVTAASPNGRVLSAWPAALPGTNLVQDCTVTPCATYSYLQGTSMASPHVAGVAALIISEYGKMSPKAMRERIRATADPIACPPNPFLGGTPFEANCSGPLKNNSFYGKGQVNALSAISGRCERGDE